MRFLADLHLHSRYSRAVSDQMNLGEMVRWAEWKGVRLLGTGDFTHPLWLAELKNGLEEEKRGIFKLKDFGGENGFNNKVKFVITGEISSIYSFKGKVRKIHNLILVPSFEVAERVVFELKRRGCNLASDGRPIISLSARDLLRLVLEIDERCMLVPCHIWTPHFSLFGSESGFESLEECFEGESFHIKAVETGLSSDPWMNWQVEELDKRLIVSFSDAHSPTKLGREATILEGEEDFDYEDLLGAFEGREGRLKVVGTVEFYPEEGKYHYTGHRNCGVVFSPEEVARKGVICPVCGKRLTIGVMEQVKKLGRKEWVRGEESFDENEVCWITREGKLPFVRLVPLIEILEEVLGVGEGSKQIEELYFRLIGTFGNEFEILTRGRIEEIARIGGEKLGEAVKRVRKGAILVKPGFDGQYGRVKIFGEKEENKKEEQMSLW